MLARRLHDQQRLIGVGALEGALAARHDRRRGDVGVQLVEPEGGFLPFFAV